MIDSFGDRDPLELLADEFASRCRNGESPLVSDYATEYPQHAQQIEELFPAVAMMEQLRVEETGRREDVARHAKPFDVPKCLGDFEIIKEIGRGGMGIVYEAEQRSLARRVAVKILPPHVHLDARHLERFQREAQTAAKLRHTGIVPVFGVGEQDGLHYYVMPLVRGVSLDEIIRELREADGGANDDSPAGGNTPVVPRDISRIVTALISSKFPTPASVARDSEPARTSHRENVASRWFTVARLGAQAADAIENAHAHGTLHRDIKPGNLLVGEDGNACVADFGLARVLEPSKASGGAEIVGTPRYMAPEQFRGLADARTDIYSLGLTLRELVTLQRTPSTTACEAIPCDLEAILLKCLAHEPADRYQTASALAADLRRFLASMPIKARQISWLERAWRWSHRNPSLAIVSALAVALVVAVITTALTGYIRTRNAYTETREALVRADATSRLTLEALEGVYLQLSPERVWIPSDSDSVGQACACVGLRSARPATMDQCNYIQVQASEQTAILLENLLVFYDRLAEQVSDDGQVMLGSAIATRRVGDIRQRLGQLDLAEQEYLEAIEKLNALREARGTDPTLCAELARCHNEIGNVQSARFHPTAAYQAHLDALTALKLIVRSEDETEEYQYELARTCFLLSSKYASNTSSGRGKRIERSRGQLAGSPFPDREYRKQAISQLEQLTRKNPEAADYRFLLALCYRPCGIETQSERDSTTGRGRERSLEILQALKRDYPQVADYRYELAATYAWVHVRLFPWQSRSVVSPTAEHGLRKALDEAQWLVDHNPTIPHYARSKALILAKLGAVCWELDRLAEASELFEQALRTQAELVYEFPDLLAHDKVLLEFFRLRQAATYCCRDVAGQSDATRARELLEACVQNLRELSEQPELADDRLAAISLEVAEDALSRLRSK